MTRSSTLRLISRKRLAELQLVEDGGIVSINTQAGVLLPTESSAGSDTTSTLSSSAIQTCLPASNSSRSERCRLLAATLYGWTLLKISKLL